MRKISLAAVVFLLCHAPYTACADLRIDEHAWRALVPEAKYAAIGDPLGAAIEVQQRKIRALLLPAKGAITSYFGSRTDPLHRGAAFHEGIDIANAAGSRVRAAGAGVVRAAGRMGGCGIGIVIDHGGGIVTRYCHMGSTLVTRGERVEMGAPVGLMGSSGRSTGPHLHFEVRDRGRPVDPIERLYL